MQQHMFWALFIHAQDAQEIADDPAKQQDVWNDLRDLRQLFRATPWKRGQTALRHVPPLEDSLLDYYTRGTYDEYWDRVEHDYTRYWDQHADIPVTLSTGWYDPFPTADTEYFTAMTEKNSAPARLVVGPWSHVGMRGDATFCLDVDFGAQSAWGVKRYFDEQLEFFNRFLPDDATGQPAAEAPVRIFVMGGGSGRKTAEGKLDHGGRWREEWEWPLARRVETAYYLHSDGSLATAEPPADAAPRRFTFDPAHPVPTVGGLHCSIGELPAEGAGMEQAWARFLSPVLRLRDLLTPGPADQVESPAIFGSEEPYPRLSERPDVLVFQTEPLAEPVEVTGPMTVHLWISSSALDTDFTAKLVDVHPANEDYPDGYDMLLNDSVIRCRYREGFDREVLLEPGVPVPVTISLPPTSNLFDVGHRIRVDISSSNWPRLDVNPNTGEPMGRHTHQVVAEQTVYADADAPVAHRPAGDSRVAVTYGIVAALDVMVPMRDGVRLAFDVYRPGLDGSFAGGRFPTIMCHTAYDKATKRYVEIADFFVPRGYAVVLVDMRDRYRSEGSGTYFHSATPHTGRDGYDIVEWIAAQPWSNGRVGTVGSSYAGQVQVRTALERPPHLSAIWPDVVTTNNYANCAREGGAMQGHMFWALFIHAQDAQDIADDPARQQDVWNDLRDLRRLYRATPWQRGQTSLRHVPTLEQTLIDYATRGTYDAWWAREECDYTAHFDRHADVPMTVSSGWFDPWAGPDADYWAAMAAQNSAPQRLVLGPWSHVGMRGEATYCHEVDFGPDSVWGVERYFEEQLDYFSRWLPDDATGHPAGEAPIRLFVMGGGSGRRTAEGKLDHGGGWREEWEWPLARRVETTLLPPRRREPLRHEAGGSRRAAALHLRPGAAGADGRRGLLRDRRAPG